VPLAPLPTDDSPHAGQEGEGNVPATRGGPGAGPLAPGKCAIAGSRARATPDRFNSRVQNSQED